MLWVLGITKVGAGDSRGNSNIHISALHYLLFLNLLLVLELYIAYVFLLTKIKVSLSPLFCHYLYTYSKS